MLTIISHEGDHSVGVPSCFARAIPLNSLKNPVYVGLSLYSSIQLKSFKIFDSPI